MWFKVTLILLILAGLWAGAIYGHRLMILIDGDNPHPVAVNATIERRLHLILETEHDTNKPKKYVCREVK